MRCTFSRVNTFGSSARPLRDVPCVHGRPRFRTTMRVRTPTIRYKFCGVAGHAVHDDMRCLLAVFHSVSDLSPTCENVRRHSKSGVQTSQRGGCTSWRVNTCGFITRSSAAFHCVPRHRRFGVRLTPVCFSTVWCRRCGIHNHKATDSSLAREKGRRDTSTFPYGCRPHLCASSVQLIGVSLCVSVFSCGWLSCDPTSRPPPHPLHFTHIAIAVDGARVTNTYGGNGRGQLRILLRVGNHVSLH